MIAPKFAVGDNVRVASSGSQGIVVAVDTEKDIYTVQFLSFRSDYTRVMLKRVVTF